MTITGITLRNTKGSELTFTEMDNNFTILKETIEEMFNYTITIKGLKETIFDHGDIASGAFNPNCSSGTVHKATLTGDIVIDNLSYPTDAGSGITLLLTQDGAGGHLLSSSMKWSNGYKTLSTAPYATDVISIFYDGTNYFATLSKGYS